MLLRNKEKSLHNMA